MQRLAIDSGKATRALQVGVESTTGHGVRAAEHCCSAHTTETSAAYQLPQHGLHRAREVQCSRVVGCKFTDGQLASSKIYQFAFLNWLLPVKFRSVLFCWIRLCQACVARRVHHACIERASCTLTIARQRQQTVPWRLLLGTATATIAVYCVRHSMAAAGAPAPLRMSFSIGVSIKLQKLA